MNNYSGIIAIFVYGAILAILLRVKRNRKPKEEPVLEKAGSVNENSFARLDENDEDALVACLTAAIACREELHKNVEIIGVRRVD